MTPHRMPKDRNFISLLARGVKFFLSQLSRFEQGYCKVEKMQSNLFSNAGSKDLQISCPGNEPLLHHTCQTVTPRDVSVFVSIYQPGNNVINNVEIYKKLHMLDFRTDHTSQNIAIKATVY